MTREKHAEVSRKIDAFRLMEKLRRSIDGFRLLEPLEWILLFLYAANGRVSSRIHLQKGLFILSRHIDELRNIIEFDAYRMGPWSEEVSDALENAILNGFASESRGMIVLTEYGFAKAKVLWDKLSEKYRKILLDVARFVNAMSRDELLLYIYTVYGYSEKSDVINELLAKRREIATNIFLKGLISIELASKIAGEPVPKFIEYLKKRGIKPFTAEVNDIEEAGKL